MLQVLYLFIDWIIITILGLLKFLRKIIKCKLYKDPKTSKSISLYGTDTALSSPVLN